MRRLAGDALSKLMQKPPERPLGPAYERLLNKAEEFNMIDRQLVDAGVPSNEFNGMQRLQVPTLSNGVPAPYVDTVSKPGIERRVHLVEEDGELYPVANENPNAGAYLVTEFGKNVNMEGQDKASEYVQDHILRLMGHNPQRGPHAGIDFIIERDGKKIGIDGQTQMEGQPAVVEAYTKVLPTNRRRDGGGYGYGYAPNRRNPRGKNTQENVNAIKRDVKNSLRNAMNEGRTFNEAMEFLRGEGYFVNNRDAPGKLYKSDYDEVLMPIQNQQQHIANANNDIIAIAPEGVLSYDLNDIGQVVNNIRNPNDILASYNAGFSGQDKARVKLRAQVPSQYVRDVVAEAPYVAQMLRQLPYQ